MIFVDSNIPMYLVGKSHPNKLRARELLDDCFDSDERLVSDVEVLQEILHRYTSIDRRDAIQPAFDALEGIVDEIFAVDVGTVELAKQLALTSDLSARDSLHVAVMRLNRVDRILTFDHDFDKVRGLVRLH